MDGRLPRWPVILSVLIMVLSACSTRALSPERTVGHSASTQVSTGTSVQIQPFNECEPHDPNPWTPVYDETRERLHFVIGNITIQSEDRMSYRTEDCVEIPDFFEFVSAKYCSGQDLEAFVIRPGGRTLIVQATNINLQSLSQMLANHWTTVPAGCESTSAAEMFQLRQLCMEMEEYFTEQNFQSPDPLLLPHPLGLVASCDDSSVWEGVLIMMNGELSPDERVAEMETRNVDGASFGAFIRENEWVLPYFVDDFCNSDNINNVALFWNYCDLETAEALLREHAVATLEQNPDIVDYEWYEDASAFEVAMRDPPGRTVLPLYFFHPVQSYRVQADVSRSVGAYHSRRDSRGALCEVVEEYYQDQQPEGSFMTDVFRNRHEVTREARVNCVGRYESGSSYSITGRASWRTRDVHTGSRGDIYSDFNCSFRAIEMLGGTYHQLLQCVIER